MKRTVFVSIWIGVVGTLPAQTIISAQSPPNASLGPKVVHTGRAPTGYEVTFRYSNPTATNVSIKGTWSFSSASKEADDPQNLKPIPAAGWKPGDFPLPSPNQPGEAWPVARMTKEASTGVWTYTLPLPSGWTDYQFYPNCSATPPSTQGCTAAVDPANPTETGCANNTFDCTSSTYAWSEVYVPSDAKFGTTDLSWQTNSKLPITQRGTVTNVAYANPFSTAPAPGNPGTHNMIVYLPAATTRIVPRPTHSWCSAMEVERTSSLGSIEGERRRFSISRSPLTRCSPLLSS
jgi:hypothetical protein